MKKRMRKMLHLVLVVLLTATMVENTLYYAPHGTYGVTHSALNPSASYISTSVTANRVFISQGATVTGTIQKTFVKFWVGSDCVVPGAYADPG